MYRYTGAGNAHYIGIPARDLSRAEFEALDEQQQEAVLSGNLYKAIGEPKKTVDAGEPKKAATSEPKAVAADEPKAAVADEPQQAATIQDAFFGDAAPVKDSPPAKDEQPEPPSK